MEGRMGRSSFVLGLYSFRIKEPKASPSPSPCRQLPQTHLCASL